MERRASVSRGSRIGRLARATACALLLCQFWPALAGERLLLLAGARCPADTLSSLEVHRLFLGLTVIVDDHRLHALRNESDDLMRRIFFQNIVSMSESAYDRRMLALTLQQGRSAPPVIHSTAAVLDALAADPTAVSFAWDDDAARDPRVKVLRVLWRQ